ncbi:hypothetical protein [Streptomyces sp. NPDC059786]|uniref:hypothetical protein n=1 Tax=Streptomyces sp. NPDC059786 TaxID=3346946 RepID=UPI00365AB7B2
MSESIRTFSGAHPFRPQCIIEAARHILEPLLPNLAAPMAVSIAERAIKAIDTGTCPRCSDPLRPEATPNGWRPAGSRATACRCIPVCETCANWIEPFFGGDSVAAWPTDEDLGEEETQKEIDARFVATAKAACTEATLEPSAHGPVVVTDGAVHLVQLRPHPGGWLEYGYTDDADQQERQA